MQTRIVALSTDGASVCWLVPDFLSASECDDEIAAAQLQGFVSASGDFPPSYRNNRRLVRDDPARADALYARLLTHIAASALECEADGRRWRPTGVNPRLRYCRYEPGEAFHLHQDGVRHEADGRRSFLTFMIYLDDPAHFEGGATRFFAHGPQGDANGEHPVRLSLRPSRGSLIVFDHALWHDGAEVLSGTKHVLRSDVLFSPDETRIDGVNDAHARAPFEPGHDGYVWKLLALRDGRIASAGRDARVRLWSSDGLVQDMLIGHTQSVLALAQPSDDTLCTLSRDRTLRRWDLSLGNETGCAIAHDGAGLALAADAEGTLISGGADGALRRWQDMRVVAACDAAHAGWIWEIALHQDIAISVGEDGFARLWRREDLSPITALPHPQPLRAVAVRNDETGVLLVCGDMRGEVHVWRTTSTGDWHRLHTCARHRAAIRALRWLPDGRLGSAGEDGRVVVGDIVSNRSTHEAAHHANFATDLIAFADGRLVSAGYDGRLRLANWGIDASPPSRIVDIEHA